MEFKQAIVAELNQKHQIELENRLSEQKETLMSQFEEDTAAHNKAVQDQFDTQQAEFEDQLKELEESRQAELLKFEQEISDQVTDHLQSQFLQEFTSV